MDDQGIEAPDTPGQAKGHAGPDKVGIILVHGIGEQRRFQHLDSQLRYLLRALKALRYEATVDINSAASAAFHAEQDTWSAGPEASVHISVKPKGSPETTHDLFVHEVWWADVNEPYSIAKQARFWFWGLAVWAYPGKLRSNRGSDDDTTPPKVGGHPKSLFHGGYARLRLYLVGVIFALGGVSVGLLTFLASRLFNWQPPRALRAATNYISGVKLYNEKYRHGSGLGWTPQELLDNVGCPPRVSVRRRMIRAIADVACSEKKYDRWYVFAHSLGSIVAFNGLMETEVNWPGYLDRTRWERLKEKGLVRQVTQFKDSTGRLPQQPPRPVWAKSDEGADWVEGADRAKIFGKFRGLLTYGSPLEKFATIWPARVPVSTQPAFPDDAKWINVFDPLDPVSGVLTAFSGRAAAICPEPLNIGYKSHPILLESHLHYLDGRDDDPNSMAARAVAWVLADNPNEITGVLNNPSTAGTSRAFEVESTQTRLRTAAAWASWGVSFYVLAALAAITFPPVWRDAVGLGSQIWTRSAAVLPLLRRGADKISPGRPVLSGQAALAGRITMRPPWEVAAVDSAFRTAATSVGLAPKAGSFVLFALVAPLVAGLLFRACASRDEDDVAWRPSWIVRFRTWAAS